MRISDWSSDVCSSDLQILLARHAEDIFDALFLQAFDEQVRCFCHMPVAPSATHHPGAAPSHAGDPSARCRCNGSRRQAASPRSEEHTSELQSLMRISYAVFCLKKKKHI